MARIQPSNARGLGASRHRGSGGFGKNAGTNRDTVALAKRGRAARQTKSHAMMKQHTRGRKGTRNLSWWMSAGR